MGLCLLWPAQGKTLQIRDPQDCGTGRPEQVSNANHLLEKKESDITWQLKRLSVFHYYSLYETTAKDVAVDDAGFLVRFSIQLELPDGRGLTTLTLEMRIYGGFTLLIVW